MDSNCRLKTQNQTVKDPPFPSGTRQNPTLVYLTRIGSTMSQGRTPTPRLGLDRLSRDTKHNGFNKPVKQDSALFTADFTDFPDRGARPSRVRQLPERPAETRQKTEDRRQTSEETVAAYPAACSS